MSYDLEFNARALPAADVARFFVPPDPHFAQLLSRSHTLILGPRGSGKTTLLKMLTVPALTAWTHPKAEFFSSQIPFNAAFIPADIAWNTQFYATEVLNFYPARGEAAFVIHTLRALVRAMREAIGLGRKPMANYLVHLSASLTDAEEESFVRHVATALEIRPSLNTLLGMQLSLEASLNDLYSRGEDSRFTADSFPSKVAMLISTFNGMIGDDDRRWALLFDEFEIAPARIRAFLLASIRSFDERIIVKLAIAPYMEDAVLEQTPTSPHPLHDYHTVHLSYPNKSDANHFSSALFLTVANRLGMNIRSLDRLFDSRPSPDQFGRRSLRRDRRPTIPAVFHTLSAKDDSFKRYVDERNLFSSDYKLSESNLARDVRKVLPIVISRDYYLRLFSSGKVVSERSRKSYELYTGYPSVVEITEGNPRAVLTLLAPLAEEYRQFAADADSSYTISVGSQSEAIRRAELLITSLLQVIPLDLGGFEVAKGLLDFVDQIGRALEERLLRRPFSADYVGTFVLDDNVAPAVVRAVGKAINAGAIIHVPYPDSGPDSLLRGLRGQRFRLSYALAPRFRLLLTLGDRVNLSKLLMDMRGLNVTDMQPTLFDGDFAHDH